MLFFFNKSWVYCSWPIPISPGFLSNLNPRNHLRSPFHQFSQFEDVWIFLRLFICFKSELAMIMSSTHTRIYVKQLSLRLTCRQKPLLLCWKLSCIRKILTQSKQFLLACFRPRIDFLSLHNSLVLTFAKLLGCFMNIFSLSFTWRKADFISNCSKSRLCCAAAANISLNVSGRPVGASAPPKTTLSVCANPSATNLALYFSAFTCSFLVRFNTHLPGIVFRHTLL